MPILSERRACRVLDQHRSAQRYQSRIADDEPRLVEAMLSIVRARPRFGYRRVWALLRAEGWRVNRKRVHRLWRKKGLKVPQKRVKKRRLGVSGNSIVRRRATKRNEVWSIDFIFDRTANGRSIKWLSVIDEFTMQASPHRRECLALEVKRSMGASEVMEVLSELVLIRGGPVHVRCDNGPKFIAQAIRRWLECSGVKTLYVEPASPWQNGFVESFHSRLRDELLAMEVFETVKEAKRLATNWRLDYNHRRPHSGLKYLTPAAFAGTLSPAEIGAAPLPPSATAKEVSMVRLS